MKANELRIGNLLNRQDYICKVVSIDEEGCITEPLDYKGSENFVEQKLEPIPLTEEWLLKFGLKTSIYDSKRFLILGVDIYIFDNNKIIFNPSSSDLYLELKYVHQLQNLFFAFKGEELTIKEQ